MPDRSEQVVMQVEASLLSTMPRLPSCCAPHGLTAVDRIPMRIPSPTPRSRFIDGGAGVVSLVSGVARIIAALRVTQVDGWPVCVRCRRRRGLFRTLTRLFFWGGLVAMVAGFLVPLVTGVVDPVFMVPALGGPGFMLVSSVTLTVGQPARIAGLQTLPDGTAVRFTNTHPEFVRQIREILGDRWVTGPGTATGDKP